MKKITLIALLFFLFCASTVVVLGFVFPPPKTGSNLNTVVNPSTTTLTIDVVAQHSTSRDCYLVIKKKVYDVSSYITIHPGGRSSITSRCGKEVTTIFASIHSNFAWDLLNKYYIGPLVSTTSNPSSDTTTDAFPIIEQALKQAYQGAEIINIKPSKDFYIAKLIYQNKLYEIHVRSDGSILNEEVEDEENDWSNWDTDRDDF